MSETRNTRAEDVIFENRVRYWKDRYKVRRGEDKIWEIPCVNGGDIEPYSMTELCCFQSFKSAKGINSLKRRLPEYCTVTQEGGEYIVFKFPNERLDDVAEIVKAPKVRHLSPERKSALLAARVDIRFQKNTTHTRDAATGMAGSAAGGMSTTSDLVLLKRECAA